MQNFEYLQISINYYSSAEKPATVSNNEDVLVWKGLRSYFEILDTNGWIIINETKAAKGQSRTYQFKRQVEANAD